MSNLPPEILDYILDLLHDEPETLKECCLVSKSWVPCTRKHLFADIKFNSADGLESWKKTFPDHSSSPAYHARTLWIGCPEVVTVGDAEEGGWIRAFSRVEQLVVRGNPTNVGDLESITLTPYHGFSPTLKSLRVFFNTLPNPQIPDLISTLPILENMSLVTNGFDIDDVFSFDAPPTVAQPSTSPPFTGSLDLTLFGGMGPVTRRLLDLPNGLHFREFALSWLREEDLQWIIALIAGCSHTLERLFITCFLPGALTPFLHPTCNSSSLTGDAGPASIDLSKATNLKNAVFLPTSMSVKWIVLALQTITPKHRNLRGISIYVPYDPTLTNAGADVAQVIGDLICGQWLDLDRLLVQIWESRSIRPKVLSTTQHIGYSVGGLLPEITKRGIIDLACRCYVPQ